MISLGALVLVLLLDWASLRVLPQSPLALTKKTA